MRAFVWVSTFCLILIIFCFGLLATAPLKITCYGPENHFGSLLKTIWQCLIAIKDAVIRMFKKSEKIGSFDIMAGIKLKYIICS